MSGLIRSLAIAVAGAVVGFALVGGASAETRLFSIGTDRTDVSVVGATRDGVQLPVAGQNGNVTFFRADNPSGSVPCSNRLQISLSNGQTVDRTADLCATNWALTVALDAGGGAQPAAVSGSLVVATDDSSVSISSVFLAGNEVPIVARQDPYVEVNLDDSDPRQFSCSRDLGLALSDGRRIARLVDVCATNFVVVVNLVGGTKVAPPPGNMVPQAVEVAPPSPAPQPPQPAPPVAAPQPPSTPDFVDTMQWQASTGPDGLTLSYATPNTDEGEFSAFCAPQSRQVEITLDRTVDGLAPGDATSVRFTAGDFDQTYAGRGSEISGLDGLSHPQIDVPSSDPIWGALIRERALTIEIGGGPTYALSLAGSSAQVKEFLVGCNPPAPVAPKPPILQPAGPAGPGPALGGGLFCSDGSTIAVTYSGNTAVVSEQGLPPVVLYQTRSLVGARFVAGYSELISQGPTVYWVREGQPQRVCSP